MVGWYHSHPGYSCWLSTYEILTLDIILEDKVRSLAIMIDSMRTVSTGKVEIGAFKIFGPVFNNKISPLDRFEECSIFRKHVGQKQSLSFFSSLVHSWLLISAS